MIRILLPAALLLVPGTPARAQAVQTPLAPVLGGRTPVVSAEVLQAQEALRLRADLDAAKTQIAKLRKQLDTATGEIAAATAALQKPAAAFGAHSHIVNGVVGVGFSSTIDGDKAFMRYVMPPYNAVDGLQARRTGGPVEAAK